MAKNKFLSLVLGSLLLSGCANTVLPTFSQEPDYSQLYLRGVFTWWEADEKYKLIESTEDKFTTQVKLIADGQPYDFRFADINWSPDLNCGYLKASNDQVVSLNRSVRANCESKDENFKFTPDETGIYEFSIDFSSFGSPKVAVEFISN